VYIRQSCEFPVLVLPSRQRATFPTKFSFTDIIALILTLVYFVVSFTISLPNTRHHLPTRPLHCPLPTSMVKPCISVHPSAVKVIPDADGLIPTISLVRKGGAYNRSTILLYYGILTFSLLTRSRVDCRFQPDTVVLELITRPGRLHYI
jgi:hypothetical protein